MALQFEEPPEGIERKPWERQEHESPKAWEAFLLYREMGVNRTLTSVAEQLKKSVALLSRWSTDFHWKERVRTYDLANDNARVEAKQQAIAEVSGQAAKEYELSTQRTLLELARLAYSDPRKLAKWDADGNVEITPSDLIDDHTAAAISEISWKIDKEGNKIPKFKFHNKLGAINLAGQHQNLWKAESQQTTINNNYLVFLTEMRALGEKLKVVEMEYAREEAARKEGRED